jgi:hypothetical protein
MALGDCIGIEAPGSSLSHRRVIDQDVGAIEFLIQPLPAFHGR